MSFDWAEYLGFAQSLIGDPPTRKYTDGAKFRAAVSRAYYAAHGMARERLKYEGHKLPDEKVHRYTIEQFRNSKDRNRATIADDLDRLLEQRVKADYRANAIIEVKTAQFANKLAQEIIQRIDAL